MPALTRVSNEIWSEIASFLPRRDLRNLLLVPHVLSSIASRLLFGDVRLQFGTAQFDDGQSEASDEIDKWHAQRNADILIRLVSDTEYAGLVKSLSVWVQEDASGIRPFQIGAPIFLALTLMVLIDVYSNAGERPSEAHQLESISLPFG